MSEQTHIEEVIARSKLTFEDSVVAKIAGKSAQNVDGILSMNGSFLGDLVDKFKNDVDPTKGIDVEVGEKQVAVDIEVILEYGKNAREIFKQLTTVITKEIESITGLVVIEVNTHITDVMTRKEWQQQSNTNKQNNDHKRVN